MVTKLKDFYQDKVREFGIYACDRSIPSGVDGLKPSQRKIIFGMTKLYPKDEVKVSIASASIMAVTAYHHGSLEATMVKMAQSFAGSNNMPLLEGIGQFGSRISPEASAARYIFTKTTPTFGKLVLSDDTPILKFLDDDGMSIEPEFYLPILPLVLINGADGMATGYATHILQYDPKEVRKRVIERLKGNVATSPLVPFYNGYKGHITRNSDGSVTFEGLLERVNSTTLEIKELPIGKFTKDYRQTLNELKSNGVIKSYTDESNEEETKFVLTCPRETTSKSDDDLKKLFGLKSKDSENIVVWTENKKIRAFDSADSLLNWFVDYRLSRYPDRKESMLSNMESDLEKMKTEIKFITAYLKNSQRWAKEPSELVISELQEMGFQDPVYLLGLRIGRLTGSQIEKLKTDISDTEAAISDLQSKSATELYLSDLEELKL
jgi:DNA topoisomerase-2